ncbi:MAG TPA: hypothetical protein VNZ53_01235, partial [Steroidobacteraceae bacterium]|nr:hypothetical protein [Steroidobacteraceae bacterium]
MLENALDAAFAAAASHEKAVRPVTALPTIRFCSYRATAARFQMPVTEIEQAGKRFCTLRPTSRRQPRL